MIDQREPTPLFANAPTKLHPSIFAAAIQGDVMEIGDEADTAHEHNATANVANLRERAGQLRLDRWFKQAARNFSELTIEDIHHGHGILRNEIVPNDDLEDFHRERNDEGLHRIKVVAHQSIRRVEIQNGAKLAAAEAIERSLVGHDEAAD